MSFSVRINKGLRINLTSVYTFLIVTYPVLNRYASPISIITLSEFLVLCFFIVALVIGFMRNNIELVEGIIPLLIYVFVETIVILKNYNGETEQNAIGTAARFIYIYAMMCVLNKRYFDWKKGMKYIHVWAIILAVYGALQTFFASVGYYLSTYIPILPCLDEISMDKIVYDRVTIYNLPYRCQSLLGEPAHLCQYLVLAVALYLFADSNRKNFLCAMLCTIVIVFSRSSTGILVVAFVWIMYVITDKKLSRKKIINGIIITLILIVLLLFIESTTGILSYFIRRTFGESLSLRGLLDTTRFYGMQEFFSQTFSLEQVLLGHGMIDYVDYLPGLIRAMFQLGIIGLGFLLYMFRKMFVRGDFVQRMILVLYFVLNIGTEMMFGNFAVLYMGFITAKKWNILEIENNL